MGYTFRSDSTMVTVLNERVPVGVVVVRNPAQTGRRSMRGYLLFLEAELCAAALHGGRTDLIKAFTERTYRNPAAGFDMLMRAAQSKSNIIRLTSMRLSSATSLRKELEETSEVAGMRQPLEPFTATIRGGADEGDREVLVASIKEILTWKSVNRTVNKNYGEEILAAIPEARRFIAPAATGYLAEMGF